MCIIPLGTELFKRNLLALAVVFANQTFTRYHRGLRRGALTRNTLWNTRFHDGNQWSKNNPFSIKKTSFIMHTSLFHILLYLLNMRMHSLIVKMIIYLNVCFFFGTVLLNRSIRGRMSDMAQSPYAYTIQYLFKI